MLCADLATFYMEDFIVALGTLQYFVQMLSIGVCDEDLPKGITGYYIYDLFYALCVQFVENVV